MNLGSGICHSFNSHPSVAVVILSSLPAFSRCLRGLPPRMQFAVAKFFKEQRVQNLSIFEAFAGKQFPQPQFSNLSVNIKEVVIAWGVVTWR